jgi:hypothetical protein
MPTALEELTVSYRDEIAKNKEMAESYARVAVDEQRELTDHERETMDKLFERNQRLTESMERTTRDYGLNQEVADRIKLVGAAGDNDIHYRSAGELLWDLLHSNSDADARERSARLQRAVDKTRAPLRLTRAAQHMGLDKDNTVPVAGGFGGLIVIPNVGAVLDFSPQGAPLFTALSPVPAATATFQRPRIVDPNFDTGVGGGLQEKAEGPSKAWEIVAEPLSLDVVRGYINVSELLLEMIAGSLDLVVGHMNNRLEWALERAAVAQLTSTTASIPLAADADSATVLKAIADGVVAVFQATGRWSTWIAFGPEGAGRLMALTDAAGRPMFPFLGPANALGTGSLNMPPTTIAGLNPIPTPGITDASLYIGNSLSIEAYVRRFPVMQALEPALWGRQIGVAAAAAFYKPITTEEGPGGTPPAERAGVAKIAWAA